MMRASWVTRGSGVLTARVPGHANPPYSPPFLLRQFSVNRHSVAVALPCISCPDQGCRMRLFLRSALPFVLSLTIITTAPAAAQSLVEKGDALYHNRCAG